MFGKDDDQTQPIKSFSDVSLPNQQPSSGPAVGSNPSPTSTFPQALTADDKPLPDLSIPELPEGPHETAPTVGDPADSTVPADLVSIKQQALTQLTPLVDQLDQTSEEKFRTTMMLIQATDDQKLIRTAYEAAQGIEDEKARAQALLDVINEINYFTQKHTS